MHADEVATSVALVRRLVRAQFPAWQRLPIRRVPAPGTDNTLYRLGPDKVVRLPRRDPGQLTLRHERQWLPALAPRLPVAIPVPLAKGEPGEGYPFEWSVYSWLTGHTAVRRRLDPAHAANDLAAFIVALQGIDATGGPRPTPHSSQRGSPLAERDEATREWIASLGRNIDGRMAGAIWNEALETPAWDRAGVWIHGDLDARNLLVADGRLTGVLDFGCVGVGDPAYDVLVAWKLFDPQRREQFRAAVSADEATWTRARGLVLSQAVGVLAYYTLENNRVLVLEGRKWLAEVMAEMGRKEPG
jgi:aminoglycoside phosphotransferase (APT) family kinase protein